MPKALRAVAAVSLPDGIYVMGGYDGSEYQSSLMLLDTQKLTWKQLRPMNTNRGTFSVVASPKCDCIYAVGGFNGSPLNHVERYDLMRDQWEYVAPMNQRRFMHSALLTSLERKQ